MHGVLPKSVRQFVVRSPWAFRLLLFSALLLPVVALAGFSLHRINGFLKDQAWMRRQAIAQISATVVKERFDRLVAIGESLATRVQFRKHVEAQDWDAAGGILTEVPVTFSEIERIFVCDIHGVLRTDTPPIEGVRGKSFADRDWYRGVSRDWKKYVSEVYQRAAEPRLNVIAVAIPILNAANQPAGIMVLQVRSEVLFNWADEMNVGEHGFFFVVDSRGNVAAHPGVDPQQEIIKIADNPLVELVLAGNSGIQIADDPISKVECLSAYEVVPKYNWGVFAQESMLSVDAGRKTTLRSIGLVYLVVLTLSALLALWLIRLLERNIQLSRKLQAHTAGLEYANRELESFSSSVAHDLRAPLRAIVSFSSILSEDETDRLSSEGKETIQRIVTAGHRMQEMIESLLSLAKVNNWQLQRTPVEMRTLADSVIEELKSEMGDREIQFKVGDLSQCEADPSLLRQVLHNLISNAIKYTRRQKHAIIEVSSSIENGERVWCVRDNGAGFKMEHAKRLFRVFERLHGQDEFEGIGLGLAIVQRIVRRHGGRIWAEAKTNEGAAFYFTLNDQAAAE